MLNKKKIYGYWFLGMICGLLCNPVMVTAQQEKARETKSHISFRDSLDGAFDVSDWVIEYNGFILLPAIVTEPAFGGFGGALVPIFIQQQKPKVMDGKIYPMAPDVSAIFGGYTLNNSWAAGVGGTGTIRKWGLKYKVAAGYGNINLKYYRTFDLIGEKTFKFNIKTIPVFLYLGKILKNPHWAVGLEYTFIHSELELNAGDTTIVDQFVEGKEYDSNVALLGILGEFDSRDNVFTPNKGFKVYVNGKWSNDIVGSDYKYGLVEGACYWYTPVMKKWTSGLRYDLTQVFGKAPFYLKPFLDMRGIPSARYQGKTVMLLESEHRIDVYKRWSAIGLVGVGKAFDSFDAFGSADWVYNYGTGFRYLIARKLNLRMGVDVAGGPSSWGYYIVFGSAWLRQ